MPAFTPREIHFLFERAFNARDVEAILALYEPGAVLVAGGKPVTGFAGIRDAYNAVLAAGARMKLDTRAVIESGEGLAVLHGAHLAKRILAGPPLALLLQFAGQPFQTQVPPRRRRIHTCLRRRNLLILFCVRQLSEPPHLLVRDHSLGAT